MARLFSFVGIYQNALLGSQERFVQATLNEFSEYYDWGTTNSGDVRYEKVVKH